MIRQARRLDFRSCKVGDSASMVLQLTPKLVADFASYTGDYNPLHMDQSYASPDAVQTTSCPWDGIWQLYLSSHRNGLAWRGGALDFTVI